MTEEKNLYYVIDSLLETAMERLIKLQEKTPSDELSTAEQCLDDAITFLHSYYDER